MEHVLCKLRVCQKENFFLTVPRFVSLVTQTFRNHTYISMKQPSYQEYNWSYQVIFYLVNCTSKASCTLWNGTTIKTTNKLWGIIWDCLLSEKYHQ